LKRGVNDTPASWGEFRNFELTNIHPDHKIRGKDILSALRISSIAMPYQLRKKTIDNSGESYYIILDNGGYVDGTA